MITAMEAYQKIKHHGEGKVLIKCLDFGEFYGFRFIRPELVGKLYGGSCYFTVNKNTGETGLFSPLDDFDLFSKASHLDVTIFNHDNAPD